ncbi:type II toxin-antitoxin system RelE family toxin [Shinella sp. BYT-45]|uniref:type II toxin-antitoxin system RelE family toxin n=1 Tax=Shinella sp. BYT-45 TaxID=3377377 RepID=UPI00397FF6E9
MKTVAYSKTASRMLLRMPRNEAARIRSKVDQYAADPASLVNQVKKLQGRPGFRLRVGDWRVIFDEDDQVVSIEEIGSRGSIYE